MAESTIPVDLHNPGQVFACLGLLEAADILLESATAAFDWNGETVFRLAAANDAAPVARVLEFIEEATVVARAPAGSSNGEGWNAKWGSPPEADQVGVPFPFPDPNSPATLPVLLRDDEGNEIALDHWGDVTKRDNVKFWAGAGGKPGAAILRDALVICKGKTRQHASDPFALSDPQSISFRFDWRRDYIPVQIGFSLNPHKDIGTVGYPLVEILAAIGMTNARPQRVNKLEYRYGVLGTSTMDLWDPIFHRAALGAERSPIPGNPFRRFVMHLDWPGQADQARCITLVTEQEQ